MIEDNTDIASLIVDYFLDQGHQADFAHDGLTGLHLVSTNDYDAIILDLALPGMDGISLCQRIRDSQKSSVPILMLTARDSLDDKLIGFNVGADDYLVKPFELLELDARVQALWRRTRVSNRNQLRVGDLELDLKTWSIQRAGQALKLNPVRLKIVRLLMENSHRVVPRRELEAAIWGDEPTESDALRTHMSVIRQTIDKPFSQRLLHTVHGIGYRLSAPNEH